MGRNIVLLGTAPASMGLAPFNDAQWEIWACSPGTFGLAIHNGVRFDRFFELHRWEPGQPWFSKEYVAFLENAPFPVVTSQPVASIKNNMVLEWERLVEKFGPYHFTSSLAWMCAMAIEQKPDKIAFYGVDMASTTEYHDQRMGCQHFAVLAKMAGIEVGVPPESDLLRPPPLYGVCEWSHAWIKQRARAIELNQRLEEAAKTAREKEAEIHFLKGALDDQDWQLHSWFGAEDMMSSRYVEPPIPGMFNIQHEPEPDPPKPKRGRPRKK